MVIRVGSSPILHTKNSSDTFVSGLFFCYVEKVRWDLNREQANLFACPPRAEKQSSGLFCGYGRHRVKVPSFTPKQKDQPKRACPIEIFGIL